MRSLFIRAPLQVWIQSNEKVLIVRSLFFQQSGGGEDVSSPPCQSRAVTLTSNLHRHCPEQPHSNTVVMVGDLWAETHWLYVKGGSNHLDNPVHKPLPLHVGRSKNLISGHVQTFVSLVDFRRSERLYQEVELFHQ